MNAWSLHHSTAQTRDRVAVSRSTSRKSLNEIGAPGGIRRLASLAMRFASEAGSRRKNPNPRKINNLCSSDRRMAAYGGVWRRMAAYGGVWRRMAAYGGVWRRMAAYGGTQDGTQHRKRHPGGTEFQVGWLIL
jgi:hypothetical protein